MNNLGLPIKSYFCGLLKKKYYKNYIFALLLLLDVVFIDNRKILKIEVKVPNQIFNLYSNINKTSVSYIV